METQDVQGRSSFSLPGCRASGRSNGRESMTMAEWSLIERLEREDANDAREKDAGQSTKSNKPASRIGGATNA
jgi:hypothetical protein